MVRFTCLGSIIMAATLFAYTTRAGAEPLRTPTTYELMINGESFLIEANRVVKLESREKPGVSYQVAVRVAPTQRLRMDTFQLDFDRLAQVDQDPKTPRRAARIAHELGFTMLVNDLGGPLEPKAREELLSALTKSLVGTFREMGAKNIETGKPHTRKFAGVTGQGIMVRYQDKQGLGHTALAYVLSGTNFAATCVVQYLDADKDDALPLLKKTLDSFRALP